MKNIPEDKEGFGNYANAIVFSKKAFNNLLERYHNWHFFHSKNGWLPVKWPSPLEGQIGEIKAKIGAIKISFLQGNAKNVRLQFTLEKGASPKEEPSSYFLYNNTKISIDKWSFTTEGEIGFEVTEKCTEDEYVYYKAAFDKIKGNYQEIHQFHINLKSQSLTGRIDYNNSKLTEDQKDAFYKNVQQLITNYITIHEKFVLLYLGAGIVPGSLSSSELDYFFPEALDLQIFNNTETAEVRFPYKSKNTSTKWNGDINIPLVIPGNEGSFVLGRESFFSYLIFQPAYIGTQGEFIPEYKTHEESGRIITKTLESILLKNKKDDCTNWIEIALKNKDTIGISCTHYYNDHKSFDLNLGKKVSASLDYVFKKEYEISLSLNFDNNTINAKIINIKNNNENRLNLRIDSQEKPYAFSSKNMPNVFKSIAEGHFSRDAMVEAFTCAHKLECPCSEEDTYSLDRVMKTIIKQAHPVYEKVLKFTEYLDTNFHVPISTEVGFVGLPESELFHFQDLNFDDEWNVCLAVKLDVTN